MQGLLIVGGDFPEVAEKVRGGGHWEVISPCGGPDELARLLAARPARSLERLDIFDHGGPGFLTLGGAVLFQSDRDPERPLVNAALAVALRDKLTATAQLRLLGCETGGAGRRRREGRLLLLKLAQLLNQDTSPRTNRVVFGTITGVQPTDFDEQGLRRASELTLLYSSYAALDHDAPSYDDRLGDVAALHGDADKMMPAPAPGPAPAPAPMATPPRLLDHQLLGRLVRLLSRPRRLAPAGGR